MQQLRRRCYWPSAEWWAQLAPNLPHQLPSRSHRFTSNGMQFTGKSTLTHRLAGSATFVKPGQATATVAVKGLKLAWKPVEGVASYSVGIKHEESNVNLTALLPASSTSFAVPDGFLVAGKKYTLAVGAVTREGNITFVETTFTTEK